MERLFPDNNPGAPDSCESFTEKHKPFCGADEIQKPRRVVLYRSVYSVIKSCSLHIKRR